MRLDVPSKLSASLFLIVAEVTSPWQVSMTIFSFLLILGVVVFRTDKTTLAARKLFLRFSLSMVVFILLITMLNGLFLQEGPSLETALGIRFYADGIEFGLTTSSRLASLSTTLMLLFLSTPVRELLSFLQQVALPSSFIVIVFLALHFIGQLPHRMAQIFTAQEARGAAVRGTLFARIKAFFWILSPLVLSSIVETVDRGTALELRGFRGHLSPQSLAASPRSPRIISIIFLCATGVLLVWSILR